MLCTRCNKHFSDEYVVCPECGDVLRKETDQFQEQLQYNNPHGESPIPDKSILYIVLSILSFFCCNQITGVIAAVFSFMAMSDYNHGLYEQAASKWRAAKITLLIGIGLVIALVICYMIFIGFAFASI